jgi:hypothetical protein
MRGQTRLHPAWRREGGSNAPTREGVRGREAEQALLTRGRASYHIALASRQVNAVVVMHVVSSR